MLINKYKIFKIILYPTKQGNQGKVALLDQTVVPDPTAKIFLTLITLSKYYYIMFSPLYKPLQFKVPQIKTS